METGRIVKGIGGFYYVCLHNGETVTCRARGRFRKEGCTPRIGDYVEVTPQKSGDWALDRILPRRNELVRPPVSNIDQLVIVVAASNPAPDWLLVDKLLLEAQLLDISPILVLNKIDEACDTVSSSFLHAYGGAFPCNCISTTTGEGLDALTPLLAGKTTCLAGQSAVGKSSLINALLPGQNQDVGALSEKTDRGRHTTRHAELLSYAGGMLVDTPGFSLLDTETVTQEQLDRCYPEFSCAISRCRFAGCSHITEPDCAVKELVSLGKISKERYERYTLLHREVEQRRKKSYD